MEISIIIPIYNSALNLERCIDSILNQSFRNFELILINDGSTDASGLICDEYKNKDERVTVIHIKNQGVSHARNLGINIAKNEWIMFVDSDDTLYYKTLEKCMRYAKEEYDLMIFGIELKKENKTIAKYLLNDKIYSLSDYLENINEDYALINFCCPVCKLYRRKIIREYNLFFNEKLSMGEDTDFNINYISKCKIIKTISDPFYTYYRDNANSLFSKPRNDLIEIHQYVYSNFFDLCNEKSTEKAIRKSQIIYNELLIGCLINYVYYQYSYSEFKLELLKLNEDYLFQASLKYINLFQRKMKIICKLFQLKLYFLIYIIIKINVTKKRIS